MSTPAEFYNSLPPISKAYGTLCVVVTTACQLGLLDPSILALEYKLVFSFLQVWRLITSFFFLGTFSINFGIRLLMIARYGVNLEKGPFERRTADFLWMMIFGALSLLLLSAIPIFKSYFLGISLVFMLVYVWSKEFPTAQINIYGLVTLKAFYLPWAMLALDIIFGSPLIPDLLGIIAGHLYYFLTVLHPLATGKNLLKTPKWVYPYFAWFLTMKNHTAWSNVLAYSVECETIIRGISPTNTHTCTPSHVLNLLLAHLFHCTMKSLHSLTDYFITSICNPAIIFLLYYLKIFPAIF